MLHGNALCLGESVGLLAEGLRELLAMVREIDVLNLLPIEVGIDAPIVTEAGLPSSFGTTFQLIKEFADLRQLGRGGFLGR